MNRFPGPNRLFRRALKKPWNLSALILALASVLLLIALVFSVQSNPSKSGDYLQLIPRANTIQQSKQGLVDLLSRGQLASPLDLERDQKLSKQVPMSVSIGVYAMNNYNIDPQIPAFDASGYMWFKWDDRLQEYLVSNELKIWKVIAPINLLDIPQSADSIFVPTGKDDPIRMSDGTWYQTVAYKGTFFIDKSDFRNHPFARLSLPIMMEADDIMLSYSALRLVPDLQGSGVGQFIDVNTGWVNQGWSLTEYKHYYATDFGFGEGASEYSQLVYDVRYATDSWSAFWKTLMPLLIVMAMIVGATKLDPIQYEVRLTLPVTVLLTLVFLQQSHAEDTPNLPYLTFLDEIYVVCYVLTLASFLLMIWGCRRYYQAIEIEDLDQRSLALNRLDKSDNYWPSYVILAGLVSLVICWFTN